MEVLSIKAVIPTGLNYKLKAAFPHQRWEVVSIVKPEFLASSETLKGHWIAGFTQADGSFGLNFFKSSGMKLGESLRPSFRLSQAPKARTRFKSVRKNYRIFRLRKFT